MRKLGKDIEVDDKMLSYAIINGLKSHISAYVTQQKATTLDNILKNARIVELTVPAEGSTNDLVEQIADMRSQLNKMNEAFMRATAAPVGPYQQPEATAIIQRRWTVVGKVSAPHVPIGRVRTLEDRGSTNKFRP